MREAGWLDGFPLHLLAAVPEGSVALVLDHPALGLPQLDAVPGGGALVIAAARDPALLRTTGARARAAGARVHAVRADPARLPFRAGAVHGVVHAGAPPPDLEPLLSEGGWQLAVGPPRERCGEGERAYFVRPAAGREYFATRRWTPRPWPFRALQLGLLRRAALALGLAASRLSLAPAHSALRLSLRARGEPAGPADAWPIEDERFGLFAKAAWNALLLGADGGRTIVKFPLIDVAAQRMGDHAEHLDALREEAPPELLAFLPQVLDRGRDGGQAWWTEVCFAAAPATRLAWRPAARRRAAGAAAGFALALHRETRATTRISRAVFDGLLKPRLAALTREGRRVEPAFDLSALGAALWQAIGERDLPLVRSHGDFWSGNVLVSKDAGLSAVLDWDASAPRGWPLLDLLHLLAFQHKRRAFWHFGREVERRLLPRRLARWEHALAHEYCRGLGIDEALWAPLVVVYWLERVDQWLRTDFHEGKRNDRWLRRNLLDPAPRLTSALAKP